jgi:hypothetical protein
LLIDEFLLLPFDSFEKLLYEVSSGGVDENVFVESFTPY